MSSITYEYEDEDGNSPWASPAYLSFDVEYLFHRGCPQTHWEPGELDEIEIIKVKLINLDMTPNKSAKQNDFLICNNGLSIEDVVKLVEDWFLDRINSDESLGDEIRERASEDYWGRMEYNGD